jgi:hypothetical protein
MRNAELQCKVARPTKLTLTFRIPHSEFRIHPLADPNSPDAAC